jgi:hypothetical protein
MSFLQNSVSFAEALAVFRPTAYKTAFFSGCSFKTEVLKEPQITILFSGPQHLLPDKTLKRKPSFS